MPKGKKILMVDDSKIIRERVIPLLDGFENVKGIFCADSYSSAVTLLEAQDPDIAILDISLPDKSGIALLRYMMERKKDLLVIMLSNQSNDYYRELCKDLGASYFFDKSTEFDQVADIISSL